MPALILPVHPVLAYLWAKGELTDAELTYKSNLLHGDGGRFITSLFGGPLEYRGLADQVQALGPGLCTVLRTSVPSLARYIRRRGAVPLFQEPDGAWRYWCGEDVTRRWWRWCCAPMVETWAFRG